MDYYKFIHDSFFYKWKEEKKKKQGDKENYAWCVRADWEKRSCSNGKDPNP